jgi:thioredoxin 1
MPVSITSDNFSQEITESHLPVIVDVYAAWCGPCQQMAPLFEELEKELSHLYKFAKLNVDEARDISIQLGISSVPTFLFIKNGKVQGKEIGYMTKETLKEKIAEHIKS